MFNEKTKKIIIECDDILDVADIKKMLSMYNYNWDKYIILNDNLKSQLKKTVGQATDYWFWDVDNYKTILWIEIVN